MGLVDEKQSKRETKERERGGSDRDGARDSAASGSRDAVWDGSAGRLTLGTSFSSLALRFSTPSEAPPAYR